MWTILQTEIFSEWFEALDLPARESIYEKILVLKELGPALGRPYVDTVNGSKFKKMKELRIQSRNRPFRIFFAFDPKRDAILLVGGNKAGKKRFYEEMIPLADQLFTEYLEDTNEKQH